MVNVGDKIKILGFAPNMDGSHDPAEGEYIGRTGVVEHIDDSGEIHGTWGGLGLLPVDKYEIISTKKEG